MSVAAGLLIHDERVRRRWTLRQLASRTGLSAAVIQGIEIGRSASLESYARLADGLALHVACPISDPSQRPARATLEVDLVHSVLAELEAGHLRRHGFQIAIDEPYQHYQFAGRADLVAWSVEDAALLHIENRTRFPDLQNAAGSYNAKRAYLPAALAARHGLRRWRSQAHVMLCLWSAEILHAIRLRTESFRAICPDGLEPFERWWLGQPPADGVTSGLVVLDPLATGRQRLFIGLEGALTARPRHAGYADVAVRLASRNG